MKDNNITLLELLHLVLEQLNNTECNYAIIHNAQSLDKAITGDIDLAFNKNPKQLIYSILKNIQRTYNIKIVQCLHYDIPHGYYFIIEYNNDFLHLDCLYDPSGLSRYHLSTDFLLNDIITYNNLNTVNENNEYIYNLIKRALKGNLNQSHIEKICNNYPDNKKTQSIIDEWIGHSNHKTLKNCTPTKHEEVKSLFKRCESHIQTSYKKNHTLQYYYGKTLSLIRKFNRFIHPTGIFIVIVGPDGCGKTTINNTSTTTLKRAFRKTWSFHWRPNLLPKLGKTVKNSNFEEPTDNTPSQKSKYKGVVSYIRFFYYWLDFIIGYWLVVYPKKAQSTFIIAERYYLDVLVHPERYGFSCPKWFIQLFGTLVPKPDLTILLSADPQQIYNRKPELPVNVIGEQIEKYKESIKGWGDSSIIDTSKSIEISSNELTSKVLEKCEYKLNKQFSN